MSEQPKRCSKTFKQISHMSYGESCPECGHHPVGHADDGCVFCNIGVAMEPVREAIAELKALGEAVTAKMADRVEQVLRDREARR